jgi:hypothetical protein
MKKIVLDEATMKKIVAMLMLTALGCHASGAIARAATPASDIPPTRPPHALAEDIPPTRPPHALAEHIHPTRPPLALAEDIPPTRPPHVVGEAC